MRRIANILSRMVEPFVVLVLMRSPRYFGFRRRVSIHPTANVCNAMFNAASGSIKVERDAFFGQDVLVLAARHDMQASEHERQTAIPETGSDIIVRTGAWIGSGAILCGPCVIGAHAVIGAGSVVTQGVADGWFAAGNPARALRRIKFTRRPDHALVGHCAGVNRGEAEHERR